MITLVSFPFDIFCNRFDYFRSLQGTLEFARGEDIRPYEDPQETFTVDRFFHTASLACLYHKCHLR